MTSDDKRLIRRQSFEERAERLNDITVRQRQRLLAVAVLIHEREERGLPVAWGIDVAATVEHAGLMAQNPFVHVGTDQPQRRVGRQKRGE